jgi:hypothetical protein
MPGFGSAQKDDIALAQALALASFISYHWFFLFFFIEQL